MGWGVGVFCGGLGGVLACDVILPFLFCAVAERDCVPSIFPEGERGQMCAERGVKVVLDCVWVKRSGVPTVATFICEVDEGGNVGHDGCK